MARRVALVIACVCAALPAAATADALARVRRAGVLRWGADIQGGEPYAFLDPRDPTKMVGFEVEIADGIARRLGVRAQFAQNAWPTLQASLERGDFDVILNGLEDTPSRRASLALTAPYYRYGERLVVRRGAPAITLDDVHGRRVATLASTRAHDILRERGAVPVLYEGVEEPFLDLAAGRVDAVLIEDVISDRYRRGHGDLVEVGGDVAEGGYVVAARKGEPELARAVDDALADMRRSGELERILSRWRLWNPRQLDGDAATQQQDVAKQQPNAASQQADAASQQATAAALAPAHGLGGEGRLLLEGAAMTALISLASMALAVPLGLLLALARIFGRRPLALAATGYVEVWRGTPVLLQLYLIYYGLSSLVRLDALPAAILGLGLNYAAYEAEVYRGAILSVPQGQWEAAAALGLGRWQTLRHVVLPQALRVALPTVTNDFVALLKDSSLVSVITVVELTKQMTITAVDVRSWVLPGMACAGLYFAMSWPLGRAALALERRLQRDPHPRPA